jgi:diaminohydroxyphosphoribosylaminopyrimidine deaminase/5-amino-6-(5-phosphoribosylamino)uracil reductase
MSFIVCKLTAISSKLTFSAKMGAEEHNKFMQRCIELASCAEGMTYPNPLVGSVIIHEGKIIGEGYHLKAGLPHAEVNAINSVKNKSLLSNSTLYVNLEPCSHFGKTPPCADRIISEGIPRVVVGASDSSAKVSGKGISRLIGAGCEVITGVLEKECRELNKRFFTFHEKKRPYIILKWAQSYDGFLDIIRTESGTRGPRWISGKPERVLVHKWRAGEQSILAGGRTIRTDDPSLNVRDWTGKNPLRLILSSSGNISGNSAVFSHNEETVLFTYNENTRVPGTVRVLDKDNPSAIQIVNYLYSKDIQSLFVEGGAEVLNHFIMNSLWDEARIFTGNTSFGAGVKAPVLNGSLVSETKFEGSTLRIFSSLV